jgi:hypothetical protein
MDPDEQALQREGYMAALTSREFMQALREGAHGRIAITYFEWAGANDQRIIVPWRLIDGSLGAADDRSKTADAAAMTKAARNVRNRTRLGMMILPQRAGNGGMPTRRKKALHKELRFKKACAQAGRALSESHVSKAGGGRKHRCHRAVADAIRPHVAIAVCLIVTVIPASSLPGSTGNPSSRAEDGCAGRSPRMTT